MSFNASCDVMSGWCLYLPLIIGGILRGRDNHNGVERIALSVDVPLNPYKDISRMQNPFNFPNVAQNEKFLKTRIK